jgi:hypothetical protein
MPSAVSSPEKQLAAFLAKYDPEVGAIAQGALVKMRTIFKGAIELVYDNYNALAIGFSPDEHASRVICSIAVYPRWVRLFFLQGARLPDPQKRLLGDGAQVRHVLLESPKTLDDPDIRALIADAKKRAPLPLDPKQAHRIVIRSVSEKQRPRRAPKPKKRPATPRGSSQRSGRGRSRKRK